MWPGMHDTAKGAIFHGKRCGSVEFWVLVKVVEVANEKPVNDVSRLQDVNFGDIDPLRIWSQGEVLNSTSAT